MLGFNRPVLWTYNPMVLDILHVRPDVRLVYHCVDEIKEQPGMPAREMEEAENKLLKRADHVFVTSEELYRTRKRYNNNTYLFPNVADYDHFSKARENKTAIPEEVGRIDKPIIGFVGAISSYKVDFALLSFVARSRPDWSLILIGKIGEGDPDTDTSILNHENIYMLGPRQYKDLPGYIKSFDVAMIPVALNEYTHAMFPMKFFEYLAAGKRIVSTNIDSLKKYNEYLLLSDNYDEFVSNIEKVLSEEDAGLDKRLELARKNTYKTRTEKMLAIINRVPA
jgi:glycosyltransferase involved in cell wall biosynthesis